MMKVYGGPRSRSGIVEWYLAELGIPYESVAVDLQAKENRTPEYLAINPFGRIPAIADGDFHMWESGAILLHLADKHDKLPRTAEARAEIFQWVVFINATMQPLIGIEQQRAAAMPGLLQPIEERLARQEFLVGNEFSIADVALGSTLIFMRVFLQIDIGAYPAASAYADRMMQRPAFQKAMGGTMGGR